MTDKFDSDSFLNQTVSGAMEITRVPVPEGDQPFQVADVEVTGGTTKKGKPWRQLKLKLRCLDPNVAQLMGTEEAFLYDNFFLDLDDQGMLALGTNNNVPLGKLREACGLNSDDEFQLIQLKGAQGSAQVKHKLNQDGEPRAEVKAYAPLDD